LGDGTAAGRCVVSAVLVLSSLEASLCWAMVLLRAAVVIVVLVLSSLGVSLCWAMVLLQDAVW
jgi:hypothetical protein